ncbi:pilus assembly protein [Streptomyces sp. NBC_01450]|uniref:TadE family type IV pilus minor pilin n=2 Tax=unclassified Streptomyces TaxID=2593676 RepID=UPI002E348021|nr:TadE family type IV pilus minor pilin [Streptomyces sp. NBC_01450]
MRRCERGTAGRGRDRAWGRNPSQSRSRGRPRDQGFVTAEAAVVLPSLVLVGMALVWALLAASAQIQCVDAARAGARAAARQDPPDTVLATTRRAAPRGARVTVTREGDLVRVMVKASAPGPDALSLELSDEAVALAEETVGVVRG